MPRELLLIRLFRCTVNHCPTRLYRMKERSERAYKTAGVRLRDAWGVCYAKGEEVEEHEIKGRNKNRSVSSSGKQWQGQKSMVQDGKVFRLHFSSALYEQRATEYKVEPLPLVRKSFASSLLPPIGNVWGLSTPRATCEFSNGKPTHSPNSPEISLAYYYRGRRKSGRRSKKKRRRTPKKVLMVRRSNSVVTDCQRPLRHFNFPEGKPRTPKHDFRS